MARVKRMMMPVPLPSQHDSSGGFEPFLNPHEKPQFPWKRLAFQLCSRPASAMATARKTARPLFRVSSHSLSGIES